MKGVMTSRKVARVLRGVIAVTAAAVLAGCSWGPIRELRESFAHAFHREGEPALVSGIRKYDDGNYVEASKDLESALKLGLSDSDSVRAHKYLAFISCASGRADRCRHEFRLALDIDPQMQLSPAEAGHPIWGPVFRSVKAGR
jgi:Tfp pilus assembly protein PilF